MNVRFVFLLSLLGVVSAQAQPVASRFWSDARVLSADDTRLPPCLLPGAAGNAGAFGRAIRQMEATIAALPANDPNRATLTRTLELMKRNAGATTPAPAPARPLTLAQALTNAHAWLARHEAAGLKAFQASPASKNARQASEQAMEASLLGKPNAALAALLAAHELAPGNADTLVNLGGVLTTLDLPNEALAVLNAAGTLKLAPGGPMGLSMQAVLLNNKGYALLHLGRAGEAEPLFAKALTLQPTLAEASLNRARALLCQGQTDAAVAAFRRGVRRTPATGPGAPSTPDSADVPPTPAGQPPPDQTRRPARFTFDLSHGVQASLPDLKLPATPGETAALADQYKQLYQELSDRGIALQRQQEAIEAKLKARGETVAAVDARRDALWWAIITTDDEPRLAALKQRMVDSGKDPDHIWTDFWHCEGGCKIDVISRTAKNRDEFQALCVPQLETAHNSWRGAMHNYETDLGAYLRATYAQQTALAANYSDPLWHQRASLQAEIGATTLFAGLVHDAALWSRDIQIQQEGCVRGSPAAGNQPVAAKLNLPAPPTCTQIADGFSAKVSLSVVEFSVACDSFSLKVRNPGWIGAFGQVTLNTANPNWQTTVVVGVAQDIGLPGTGVGLSATEGIYLTVDRQGKVLDLGLSADAGASASGKFGGLEIGKDMATVSGRWSFIAADG